MKITILLCILTVLNVNASLYSQNTALDLSISQKSVREVLKTIEKQSNFRFFYNEEFADLNKTVSFDLKGSKLEDVLKMLLDKSGVTFKILENDVVVITPAEDAAQQIKITGKVVDKTTGEPIPGVNVIVDGTTYGTTTNIDGQYTLNVDNANAVIVFSFIGYLTEKIAVSGRTVIDVALTSDVKKLDEIVVVGYGTQRRKDVTGSIASMNSEKIRENASSNLSQSLQGRVAGVEMTQTSSRPGSEMQIRIRGTRSLTASNDPLIVLDGIPFAGSINDINPNDIKSVDILKDASATAIYGSRGANGVILISTFKGESITNAKPVVTYNAYYGVKQLMNKYPMMDAREFIAYRKEAIKNGASWTWGADEDTTINTDWQDLMFSKGMVTSHDLGIAGSTNGGGYSFGVGYYNETTVLPGQGFERYSLRGSFDQKIGKRLKVGISSLTTNGIIEGEGTNALGTILSLTPTTNPYKKDGSIKTDLMYINNMDTYYNPLMINTLGDKMIDKRKNISSYNTFYGEFEILDGLKFHINAGFNYRQSNYGNYRGAKTPYNADAISYATIENSVTKNWVIENLLYYDKTFAQKHKIGLVAMYSREQTETNTSRIGAEDIAADFLQFYNFALLNDKGKITVDPEKQLYGKRGLESQMFRANYSFNDKYLLTATVRRDGSSVLAPGHKWHTYPAVSFGWNATNEQFMKSISWLSYLKPRVGIGQTSNQAVAPYQTLGKLATNYYNFGTTNVNGYYVSKLANFSLGWEYSSTVNFGIDFGVLDNRISGTIEYYIQKTKDLLINQNLPPTSGATEPLTTNMGKTQNKGIELSLNASILKDYKGWSWDVGFNFYANKNEIVSLASGQQYDKGNGWFVGQPIDVIYDFKKIGIWQTGEETKVQQYEGSTGQVGMIKVEYTGAYNDDGTPKRKIGTGTTLADDDRQILGSIEPDFQGGFNTRVGYKGFELSVIGNYRSGGLLVSAIHSQTGYLNMDDGRRGQIKIDYWTPTNPTNAYPKPYGPLATGGPKYGNSLSYFDASYVKITNITLAYNFKPEWLKSIFIDNLRLYVTAQNPFIFASDYYTETGLDPQPNSGGRQNQTVPENSVVPARINVVGFNTPATRNYLFGLNLTF